jgi:hypothetical protein
MGGAFSFQQWPPVMVALQSAIRHSEDHMANHVLSEFFLLLKQL